MPHWADCSGRTIGSSAGRLVGQPEVAGVLGGAVQGFVTNLVESAGRALAGALGLDFHTHRSISGRRHLESHQQPNGDWEHTEMGPDFNVAGDSKRGRFQPNHRGQRR